MCSLETGVQTCALPIWSGCQGRGAQRSAAKRTWGEPIFAENWGAPTGLESRFGSRHAGPVETSPSTARDHGPTFRTANSDACGSLAVDEDRSSDTVRRTTNSAGGTLD